ncbi:MAG: hypothetical protein AAFZ18_22195 [Myxococcota bacterium]
MPGPASLGAALIVPVVLGGELQGTLFEGSCDAPGAAVRVPVLREVAGDRARPIVMSTGDLLGADPLSGFALEGPSVVQEDLRDLLGATDHQRIFDAVLPGDFDLTGQAASSAALGNEAWTVANVELDAPHRPYRVFVRQGVRIGVTGVVDEALIPEIDPLSRPEIRSATEALDESVRVLRGAGVQTVVALMHLSSQDGLERARTLLAAMKEAPPDVVITSPLPGDPSLVRFDGLGTVLIAAPPRGASATLVELEMAPQGTLREVRAVRREVPAQPSAQADVVRNWACSELDVPVGGNTREQPINDAEFRAFILESMRLRAGAEVAILPCVGFAAETAFPLPPAPTRLDLRRALPFDNGMETARFTGAELRAFESLLSRPDVCMAGLGSGKAAGRAIDPRRRYTVVTVEFVAQGGFEIVKPAMQSKFRPREDLPTVRNLVRNELEAHGFNVDANPDPDDEVEEPALFDVHLDIGATIKSVNVENDTDAEAPQLTRRDFLGISGTVDLRVSLDLPRHRFEVSDRTRYGIVREELDEGEAETRENEDVTILEAVYSGRLSGGTERPWLPDAGASARLETEFTVPEERGYQRALLQLGVGPSWRLASNLTVRSQLGLRRELMADGDSEDVAEAELAETRVALISVAELRDEALDVFGLRKARLNVRVDHAADLSGAVRDQVLQGRLTIDIPVTDVLSLTAGLDVYVLERERTDGQNLSGASLDTSLGLKSTTDFGAVFRP